MKIQDLDHIHDRKKIKSYIWLNDIEEYEI